MAKEVNKLIKLGQELGFDITRTSKGHYMFRGHGKVIVTSGTGSDYRTTRHQKKNLRKASQQLPIARL